MALAGPGFSLLNSAMTFSRRTINMDPGTQMGAHVGPIQVPFGPTIPAMPSASCGTFPGFYASGSGASDDAVGTPFGVPHSVCYAIVFRSINLTQKWL